MLEEISFCDAHFHYLQAVEAGAFINDSHVTGCVSCHSQEDFESVPSGFVKSYGVHPQNPQKELLEFLEELVSEKKINALGEMGFDFFTEDFKGMKNLQKDVFEAQLEIAIKNQLPLIIHSRKSNECIFQYSGELKKLPGVLFHSFMGSLVEAESFLRKGITAYFSFGKQIFNNNKKVIQITSEISLDNLLLETDAPFQFLKGEDKTCTSEIKKIYQGAYILRKEKGYKEEYETFVQKINRNFYDFYRL